MSGGAPGSLTPGPHAGPDGRRRFLVAMEKYAASLDLFDVVTPEFSYPSCNIVHFDYRREARKGATLITVDVWLVQIRIAPDKQFSQTKAADGAPQENGGAVQSTPPPPASNPPPGTPAARTVHADLPASHASA